MSIFEICLLNLSNNCSNSFFLNVKIVQDVK